MLAGGAGNAGTGFGHRRRFSGKCSPWISAFGHRRSNLKYRYNGFNGYEAKLGTGAYFDEMFSLLAKENWNFS